jgi:uncharacterized membrane protein YgcG
MTTNVTLQALFSEQARRLEELVGSYVLERSPEALSEIGACITDLNRLEAMLFWTNRARKIGETITAEGDWSGGGGGSSGGGASGGW